MTSQLNDKARVLLVGSGRMGKLRAQILYANPRFEMCGIVDVNLSGAQNLAQKYSVLAFASLSKAVEHFSVRMKKRSTTIADSPDLESSSISSLSCNDENESAIDGIVLSAPTFVHDSVIREGAKYGLAIFTEKPVDETAQKIEKLFDYCSLKDVHLCCGFQRRFDESYVTTANAVKDGKVGKPLSANIIFADSPTPELTFLLKGGDIFMDLSAHDIDYIRWVLDDDVETVYATGSSSVKELENAGVHDNATMVMTFTRGTVVTLTMSRSASYGYDQRCEIFGDKGMVTVGNENANTSVLSDNSGVHFSRLKNSFPERFQQAFTAELDAFADTILLDSPWIVTKEDCVAVQKVADAAKKACEMNKIVTV